MASVSIQEKTSGVKPTVSHRFFISASGAWLFIGIRADIIHRHLGGKVALFVICHVACPTVACNAAAAADLS